MMSTTPDGPTPDAHAETRELLPWLANGTLAGAEHARVQAHLRDCPACRAQLDWERGLRAAAPPAPALSAHAAFARLRPRLGAQEPGGGSVAGAAMSPAANDPRWMRVVAALQFVAIAALGLALARPDADAGRYHTLGASAAAYGDVVVRFDPATPEREMRRVVQAAGGRVVDGPTAGAVYVLAVAPADANEALRRLRAERAVTLAEPLVGEGRR